MVSPGFPPQRYPFGWRELKTRMEATYASAFSINYVWRDLGNPKRGRGVSAFHSASRPCPLGRQGPRHGPLRLPPVDVYYEKMTLAEKHTLSSVFQMTRKLGKMLCLRDAMAVIDEEKLNSGGSATAKAEAPAPTVVPTTLTAPGSTTPLAPGPMELATVSAESTAQRSSGQCARCKGYGHWSPVCPSPRNWKWGDLRSLPVRQRRRRGG